MYFGSPGRLADRRPTSGRSGNPAPPRPRSPLAAISSMIRSGASSSRQRLERLEAVVAQVLVQVGRVELAAVLGGQVPLRAEERADRRRRATSMACRATGSPRLVGQQPVEPAGRPRSRPAAASPRGRKCRSTIGRTSSALTLAKSRDAPPGGTISTSGVWWHMPTQPTRLTTAARAGLGQRPARSPRWTLPLPWATQQEPRPTRISPHRRRSERPAAAAGLAAPSLPVLRKSSSTSRTCRGREPAVGHAVDLHHRRQRAAAQAGDLLDGEQAVGVGVLAVGDVRAAAASASWTSPAPLTWQAVPWQTLDDVLADRAVAELRVEGRDAGDGGRRDLGQSRRRARSASRGR